MKDKNYHNDIYVHGHELQQTSHRWYYHGSGIDLTFGNGEFFGGILLRALFNIGNNKYTYGPLQILTEIFGSFPGIHDTNLKFGLIPDEAGILKYEEPIAAPRIGLNPKHDPDMATRNYRFLIMPKRKHADKTGIVKAMEEQGKYTQEEINGIWG
ncbi:MAG: hypothetical protein FJY07_07975 [Bacteroidetes bacterium]|nr:hypothetical protein [Bacteroidota bacterium]